MIHAYDEQYLNDAMSNLGEAMDYAVHGCHLTMDRFFEFFITSGFAEQFGAGVPNIVSGTSGTELVYKVIESAGIDTTTPDVPPEYDCSMEYWCGWVLAYYQWYTGRTFKNIRNYITMQKVAELYPALHEAAEEKFVDTVNHIIWKHKAPTRLQSQRKISGYSQRELAEKSGVSLRSIQQYEQRGKDINKASISNLLALAKTLGCQVEDIVEYEIRDIEE